MPASQMTSAGGSEIVMVLLCIYCLQLRKPTQVPIKSIFATSITAVQARISCIFKALLSQVHTVSKDGHNLRNSGKVSAGRSVRHCHRELLLQLIQVKKGRSCSILLRVLGHNRHCRSGPYVCSTPSWEVYPNMLQLIVPLPNYKE